MSELFKNSSFKKKHRDHECYDEINIKLVPRWKTSGLSGDEWRTSAYVEFKLKGEVVWQRSFRNMETAVQAIPWFFMVAGEIGETDDKAWERANKKCAQPGCAELPSVTYKLKKEYSREGYSNVPSFDMLISFCDKHKRRGDCGLEDSDLNYEKVEHVTMEVRETTAQKLTKALEEAGAPLEMVIKARNYHYDDYKSSITTPCIELVNDLHAAGLEELAARAKNGEFDAQKWESDEWGNSPETRKMMQDGGFTKEHMAKLFGVTDA